MILRDILQNIMSSKGFLKEHIKLTITLSCVLSFCGGFPFSLPSMNSKCAKLISLSLPSIIGPLLAKEKAVLNYWPCTWIFATHGGISCCPPPPPRSVACKDLPGCRVQRLIWSFLAYESRLPEAPHLFFSLGWYGGLTLAWSLVFGFKPCENSFTYQYLNWKLILVLIILFI